MPGVQVPGLSPIPVCLHTPAEIGTSTGHMLAQFLAVMSQSHCNAQEKGEQRRGRQTPWQVLRRAQVPAAG